MLPIDVAAGIRCHRHPPQFRLETGVVNAVDKRLR
jgi:hypothetical protein